MTLDLLLSPDLRPFALALALVLGLVVLEVVLMALGLSMTMDEGDVDIEPDFEPDTEIDAEATDTPETPGNLLSWLGIGHVPVAIWVAAFLTAFGLTGFALQAAVVAVLGVPLPAGIAAIIAVIPALAISSRFARLLGRLIPKFESTAISTRSYGGRRGVITVGTARRGNPAQARFTDGHGNIHYTQVEPLDDAATLPQGTEIAIIRQRDGQLRALALSDAP